MGTSCGLVRHEVLPTTSAVQLRSGTLSKLSGTLDEEVRHPEHPMKKDGEKGKAKKVRGNLSRGGRREEHIPAGREMRQLTS